MIDVLGPEKRRRRTTQEKIAIVQQSFEPGMTVSLVARQHGVAASQLFLWRKQYQGGSLTAVAAGEQVVPASELAAAMKQIKELQRLLGKTVDGLNMLARGDLRHNAAVFAVQRHLRGDAVRQDASSVLHNGDGGLVAGGLNGKDPHDPMTGRTAAAAVTRMIRMCFAVYTMLSESCQRMVIVGYGRCFADRQNLMVCLRSMPNVFTGSCARMRCCLSENLLYRHRNGHIQAEWP